MEFISTDAATMSPIGLFLQADWVVRAVMLGLLCLSRPDAWITRYNVEMYLAGQLEEFDTSVLYDMSDDAWAALAAYNDTALSQLGAGKPFGYSLSREMKDRAGSQDFWERLNLSSVILQVRK